LYKDRTTNFEKFFKSNYSTSYKKKDFKREGKQVKEEHAPPRMLRKVKEKPNVPPKRP